MANDYYGNYEMNKMGWMLGDLSLYAKSQSDLINTKGTVTEFVTPDSIAIPTVENIISCHFFPYLEKSDLKIWETEFDSNRNYLPTALEGSALVDKKLNRIKQITAKGQNKQITTFPKYRIDGVDIGGKFKWQNEGKLWLPPFSHIILDDNFGEPIRIHPNLIRDTETNFTVKVRHSLNHLGIYTLYIQNYLGDESGLYNGSTVSGLRMPNASNVYADYMNQNRNQIKHQKATQFIQGAIGLGTTIGGLATGNPLMAGAGAGTMLSSINSIMSQYATERDLMNQGNRLTSEGSDVIHGLQMTMGLTAYYMRYSEEALNRIGWYFHLFGYKQNTVMKPNLKSRKRFNYIKTDGANLKGNGIPKAHLEELANIFNKGTTIWHIDNGIIMKDYSLDNEEV